ncbi:MAG: hypothetical protein U9Q63_01455, partial [Patescibacteria group bacterium]|nr:hypothetical protein [Patescibacteria group bacterium]
EMLVDFLSSDKLIVAGKVLEEDYKIYQLVCNNNDLVAREIIKTEASSLVCLNDKTIFYSDSGGSYFYDLTDDSKVKYTALGNNVLVKVSSDKKYIGAMVGSKFLVVDYPAVKASGVEKHYLIDRVSSIDEVGFSGDSILVNQAKTCQSDGDCGEILRINLFGSGVWKIEDRVQLKNVVVEKILGEIKF